MVNKVTLVGNVGNDPEVRRIDGGSVVVNFSLATSETYKNREGEKVTDTEWSNIVIWGKLAEIVESYVKKGKLLYLEGKNKTTSYEKDGQKHYRTDVVCHEMQMLGKKDDNEPAF